MKFLVQVSLVTWFKVMEIYIKLVEKSFFLKRNLIISIFSLFRYLNATLDRTLVKPQDLKIALAVVASNSEGQLLAWRHLKAHWHYMQSMFGNGTFTMGSMISAVTSHFATEYDHQEVSQFVFKKILQI